MNPPGPKSVQSSCKSVLSPSPQMRLVVVVPEMRQSKQIFRLFQARVQLIGRVPHRHADSSYVYDLEGMG